MVLSPDGCCVAIVVPDGAGSVDVRDARTYAPLAPPHEIGQVIAGSVALAPGATHLLATTSRHDSIAGSDREVTRLWALPGWREVARLPLLIGASFSRDGAYMAGLSDDRPLVWSMARLRSGDAAHPVALGDRAPMAGPPTFSADGTHLAMSFGENPTRVGLWTVGDWTQVRVIAADTLVAVGPGGRMVAVEERHDDRVLLRIVDTADGRDLAHVALSSRDPVVAFDLSGREVAVAFNQGIDVLRVRPRGADMTRFAATPDTVALAFADDEDHLSLLARADEGGGMRFVVQHRSLAGTPAPADVDLGPSEPGAVQPGRPLGGAGGGPGRACRRRAGWAGAPACAGGWSRAGGCAEPRCAAPGGDCRWPAPSPVARRGDAAGVCRAAGPG